MKSEQWELMYPLMVIAVMVWGYRALSEPEDKKEVMFLTETRKTPDNPDQTTVTTRQREWAEKAVQRYAEAQEKKWRNWNEAMFEPDK